MTTHRWTSGKRTNAGFIRPYGVGESMRTALRQAEVLSDGSPVAVAAGDARAAPRLALLIRSAKLTSAEGEFLCVVRDASESGVSVRLFHPLPRDVPLTLEMPNGDRHAVERVWEEEDRAGFRFRDPADIARIVEGPSAFAKRAMRVRLEVPCELLANGRAVAAVVRNLSQTGALIHTAERLSLIQRIKLRAGGMPEIAAKVRWRRGDEYGLSFEDTFQFAELAALAFDLQRRAAQGPASSGSR